MSELDAKLAAAQQELLDFSLRNNLLNYKRLQARGVEVVGERPLQLWQRLVGQGRPMSFLPAPEKPAAPAEKEETIAPPTETLPTASPPPAETPAEPAIIAAETAPATEPLPADSIAALKEAEQTAPLDPAAEIANLKEQERQALIAYIAETMAQKATAVAPKVALTIAEEVALLKEAERQLALETDTGDDNMQTAHPANDLQKRLLNTYYTARTYLEEQGVNILFLALGMLRWRESDQPDVVLRAPLVLLPVELSRASVRARFRLAWTGDEIGDNVSLRARLASEFTIQLPQLPDSDELDLEGYFAQVRQAIASQADWEVESEAVALAFFSFGTFLMYHDLEVSNWPPEANPSQHPILQALLQEGFPAPPQTKPITVDELTMPENSKAVVDADSSQTLAIYDVLQGRNLVIQGPPGTGKSQTITNLIAEALGQNKRVLFVAEKMAALEVVKRRLDSVGLGAACLELHSHKTNKKSFLEELRRTLDLGEPKLRDFGSDLRVLSQSRAALNAYCTAVNTPIAPSDVTPLVAFGEHLALSQKLAAVERPSLDPQPLQGLTRSAFQQKIERVQELQAFLGRIGLPTSHPFWGSTARLYLPTDESQVRQLASAALPAVAALQTASDKLANFVHLPLPTDRAGALALLNAVARILAAPAMDSVEIAAQAWLTRAKEIQTAVSTGQRLAQLQAEFGRWLLPAAWSADVQGIYNVYAAQNGRWQRFVSPTFWQARSQLTRLCPGGQLPDNPLPLLEGILEAQKRRPALTPLEPLLQRLLGTYWQGESTNWDEVKSITDWLIALYADIAAQAFPAKLLDYLTTRADWPALQTLSVALRQSVEQHASTVAAVGQKVAVVRLEERPLAEQAHTLSAWQAQPNKLQEMVAYNHLAEGLTALGFAAILPIAATWPLAGDHLADLVQMVWMENLINQAMRERPSLAVFDGTAHQHQIEQFCQADLAAFGMNQAQLAHQHWLSLPRYSAGGQLGTLQKEFAKKRNTKSIRSLMTESGRVIQAIKPVFMMSPLSIAMFLPPSAVSFDLVVFDEASQVRPVEAFGAILRGQQVVVVGDSKQLPPTNFFSQLVDEEEQTESPTADLESVLSLFVAQGAPQRLLSWHYRSRHESLMTVSNSEFYENKLVLFPSPVAESPDLGVIYRHLPDSVYDRGRTRANLQEAQAVAQAVMAHAQQNPTVTLGVAAFSMQQMQAIQNEVESLRRANNAAEAFFSGHPEEPFFIKNLENVQGDERDVIFISVGYGRSADGVLTMNFGPLNQEGGERRLNVLITRARLRCEIFTNLSPDDLDLNRTHARGVAALKKYLQFAQSRANGLAMSQNSAPLPALTADVLAVLQEAAWTAVPQVGSAGFALDLAVQDKEDDGRYALGILGDGAMYAQALSVRDRDRLRPAVLQSMGWQVYRLWSADWFRHRQREAAELLTAVTTSKAEPVGGTAVVAPMERHESVEPAKPALPTAPDYATANLLLPAQTDLTNTPASQWSEWIQQVVGVESPVHLEEVQRRIGEASPAKRLTGRAKVGFAEGLLQADKQGRVVRRGDFLWRADQTTLEAVRSRANLPEGERRLEFVAPEELSLAIETVTGAAFGLQTEEVPQAVCTLLGLGRVSEVKRQVIGTAVNVLGEQGRLTKQGDFWVKQV